MVREFGGRSRPVRVAFDLSYQVLPPPARRLLRSLALVPGPDFGLDAAVATTGAEPAAVRSALVVRTTAETLSR